MEFSFVLAVYNNINLTKEFYKNIRILYPSIPLVISDGGSNDKTHEWLESLRDTNLFYTISRERISFSETYNKGIKMVKTDKLVLVHNDMIIGINFLENLDKLLTEDTILSYTTIEPPIFAGHKRPGKILIDFGSSFEDFNHTMFDDYVKNNNSDCKLYDGAVFFMSAFKKTFEDVGYFDGFSFFPCFCEDDDFLIRASLKGYKLKTTECAISYHFVSKTSRFGDDFKNNRELIELNSNRNFIRKWGMPISSFIKIEYWKQPFNYSKSIVGLNLKSKNYDLLKFLEPLFDQIKCDILIDDYINTEQPKTNYSLSKKFTTLDKCDSIVEISNNIDSSDIENLLLLRFILNQYSQGKYAIGSLVITIL